MLAYNMNDILNIVPEAAGLTKEASLKESFPTDSRDSVLASGLRLAYLEKVAGEPVDYVASAKVNRAIEAYGLGEELTKMASKIERFAKLKKEASLYNADETLHLQEEVLRGGLGYGQDLLKTASYAEGITTRFNGATLSHETQLYSGFYPYGQGELKNSLEKRAYFTGDTSYLEVIKALDVYGVEQINQDHHEKRAGIAKVVTTLDQKNHYNGNFYDEAFVKTASYTVKLASKSVPFESLCKLGSAHIGDILGKEVGSALTGDYGNDKAVIESLPFDERSTLERFI